MLRKIAVVMLACSFAFAAIAIETAMGYNDKSGDAAYVSGAIGQPLL